MSAQRATTFIVVALVAFLIGGLVASQPGVRKAVDRSGLSRVLSLAVGVQLPDLQPLSLSVEINPARTGETIKVTYTMKNDAPVPVTHGYFDCLVISEVRDFDKAFAQMGWYARTEGVGVGSQDSYTHTFLVTLPSPNELTARGLPGNYFLIVRPDCFNQIDKLADVLNEKRDRAEPITIGP